MPNAIRHALTTDIAACLQISNASAQIHHANFAMEPESLQDWLDDFDQHTPHFPWFVSTADGDINGFARAMPWRRRDGYLHTAEVSVYIDPARRDERLGRKLYAALLTALRAEGFHIAHGLHRPAKRPEHRLTRSTRIHARRHVSRGRQEVRPVVGCGLLGIVAGTESDRGTTVQIARCHPLRCRATARSIE